MADNSSQRIFIDFNTLSPNQAPYPAADTHRYETTFDERLILEMNIQKSESWGKRESRDARGVHRGAFLGYVCVGVSDVHICTQVVYVIPIETL